jgi:hypothetical protein
VFLEAGSVSVVVLRRSGSPTGAGEGNIELVIHEGGAARNLLIEPPSGAELGILSLTAALDGDAVALGWMGGPRDSPWAKELTAEVAIASGELLRLKSVVDGIYDESGMRYLSHPGGGVDVIKYGDPAPGHFYDPRMRADNPLAIYLRTRRPFRFEDEAALRLGAGATVWDAVAARDGERLAIFWLEHGPATSDLASEADTVQGLYYAVLDCDP